MPLWGGEMGGRWAWRRHTLELFVEAAATCDAEGADKLFEVDRPVLVFVKNVEDIVCELAGVTERKELLVYATEFGPVEVAGWTVLEEALVPRGRSERTGAASGDAGTIAVVLACRLGTDERGRIGGGGLTVGVLLEICKLVWGEL